MATHYLYTSTFGFGFAKLVYQRYFSLLKPGVTQLLDLQSNFYGIDALPVTPSTVQESLANAKVNTRQHCVSLSCLCNSLTQIEWMVQLLLPPKHAKSREIPREFDLTAVQGHSRSSILVSIESPDVTSY